MCVLSHFFCVGFFVNPLYPSIITVNLTVQWDFPGGSDGKDSACNRQPRFDPWVGKIPWKRKWQPIPVFLLGESHGWRSLVGHSPRGRKESDMAEPLHFKGTFHAKMGTIKDRNSMDLTEAEDTKKRWQEYTEKKKEKVKSLSRVQLFATPQTLACQAPQSMEFSRQGYWSGLPFLSPGDLPNPGIEPRSPTLQADSLPSGNTQKNYTKKDHEPDNQDGVITHLEPDNLECEVKWA